MKMYYFIVFTFSMTLMMFSPFNSFGESQAKSGDEDQPSSSSYSFDMKYPEVGVALRCKSLLDFFQLAYEAMEIKSTAELLERLSTQWKQRWDSRPKTNTQVWAHGYDESFRMAAGTTLLNTVKEGDAESPEETWQTRSLALANEENGLVSAIVARATQDPSVKGSFHDIEIAVSRFNATPRTFGYNQVFATYTVTFWEWKSGDVSVTEHSVAFETMFAEGFQVQTAKVFGSGVSFYFDEEAGKRDKIKDGWEGVIMPAAPDSSPAPADRKAAAGKNHLQRKPLEKQGESRSRLRRRHANRFHPGKAIGVRCSLCFKRFFIIVIHFLGW